MEQIRSFIAITLPPEIKQELGNLQGKLKKPSEPGVKWANTEGIHLTIQFLGNIDARRVEEITTAISQASSDIPPFELSIGGLGVFPNPRQIRVVWAGIGGQMSILKQLHQNIEENLKPLGFNAEKRSFKPHLTLARVRQETPAQVHQRLGKLVAETEFTASRPFAVTAISLIQSKLTPKGAIYSELASVKLKDKK